MTFGEVVAAVQALSGRRVRVLIEGPGAAVLADLRGVLQPEDRPDTGSAHHREGEAVFFAVNDGGSGFLLDPAAFRGARELDGDDGLLRVEQAGGVAFLIEPAG